MSDSPARGSLARRERTALCDLALELGPDAPTLCGGWDAARLMAHLFVREQRPLGAVGIVVSPLAGVTEQAMDRALAGGFAPLVAKVRAPRLTPAAIGPVDRLLNTLEMLVHHEDLRRARASWDPRVLDPDDLDAVWGALRAPGRLLVRRAKVAVEIRRTDTDARQTLRGGAAEPVVVAGPVVELALWLHGRSQVREVRLTGPDDAVSRLEAAPRRL